MKGAIIGDIIGSAYEFNNIDTKVFPLFNRRSSFTDDTVMTCAVAKALLEPERDTSEVIQELGRRYPDAGYGARFICWVFADKPEPYNSYGNGSAMRVSPVGLLAKTEDEVKELSARVTAVSHNHPEGMKGAECTAMCIFLARQGKSMEELRRFVEENYYTLDKTCKQYRIEQNRHHGQEICQISVPQALECFFESTSFEDCMRNCISIGGDSDTIAAIAGGIAEAYFGVPEAIWETAKGYLTEELLEIVERLYRAADAGKANAEQSLLDRAVAFAAAAHAGAVRKSTDIPYIVHPVEVMKIVCGLTPDEEVRAAAVLHDTLEDTSATKAQLIAEFGERVAALVCSESEDKREGTPEKQTWRVRKEETVAELSCADRDAKIICLGDKLANMRDIARDHAAIGEKLWERFNAPEDGRGLSGKAANIGWYYRAVAEQLRGELGDTDAWREIDELIRSVFEA